MASSVSLLGTFSGEWPLRYTRMWKDPIITHDVSCCPGKYLATLATFSYLTYAIASESELLYHSAISVIYSKEAGHGWCGRKSCLHWYKLTAPTILMHHKLIVRHRGHLPTWEVRNHDWKYFITDLTKTGSHKLRRGLDVSIGVDFSH